jgi:hypothetical protein
MTKDERPSRPIINYTHERTKCVHRLLASDIPRGIDIDDLILECEKDPECPEKRKAARFTVVALLDRPSEKSFGMVPFLVREVPSNTHSAYGLKDSPVELVLPREMLVEQFIQTNCRNIGSAGITFDEAPDKGLCAGWAGRDFLKRCVKLKVPTPDVPKENYVHHDQQDSEMPGGCFWLEPTMIAYDRLEHWIKIAGPLACQRNSHEIATLLHWCLPDRIETHAAMWYTAPDPRHAEREIAWLIRVHYGPKEPGITPGELRVRLDAVARKLLSEAPKQ